MKKLSKLFLIIMTLAFLIPTNQIYAEPDEADEVNEEQVEEEKADDEEKVDEEKTDEEEKAKEDEKVKVDEENDNPTLYEESEEDPDQSKREKEEVKKPIETPSSVTGEKYEGSGTVTDFSTTGGKAFYTVKSPDNSVFYIVIDLDKTENNVYFMSEINGEELSLNEVTSSGNNSIEDDDEEKPQPIKEEQENESGTGLTFWLIIIIGGLGFIAYHLFFGKLKNLNPLINKEKADDDEEDEEENEADIYNDNELPPNEEFDVTDNEEDDK